MCVYVVGFFGVWMFDPSGMCLGVCGFVRTFCFALVGLFCLGAVVLGLGFGCSRFLLPERLPAMWCVVLSCEYLWTGDTRLMKGDDRFCCWSLVLGGGCVSLFGIPWRCLGFSLFFGDFDDGHIFVRALQLVAMIDRGAL